MPLFDRGFHRADGIKHLQEHGASFLARLTQNVSVYPEEGRRRLLSAIPLRPGSAVDLGPVWLRSDRRVRARVVGIWAQGQKKPWWIATSLEEASLAQLASLNDRRMAVEEQIRDTKGAGDRLMKLSGQSRCILRDRSATANVGVCRFGISPRCPFSSRCSQNLHLHAVSCTRSGMLRSVLQDHRQRGRE